MRGINLLNKCVGYILQISGTLRDLGRLSTE